MLHCSNIDNKGLVNVCPHADNTVLVHIMHCNKTDNMGLEDIIYCDNLMKISRDWKEYISFVEISMNDKVIMYAFAH